ncbi:MAG TPA: zonular occludens toxin domain-containing protein [Candidatus Nanoarchaeia archaeon]|nr:zonular occludens toxin domain-containing protein [Candidatus Nanoarchaeia archaeon]
MEIFKIFRKKPVEEFISFEVVEKVSGDYTEFERKLTKQSQIILITGRRGSGKTALGMKILELFCSKSQRKCYALGFLDAKLPWKIKKIDDIEGVKLNSVVLIDEGAITFSARDSMKERNKMLGKMMAIARHKNLSLILIVQNSAMIDLNVLRLADCLLLKEPSLLQKDFERGPIKKIYSSVIPHFEKTADKKSHFFVWDDDFRGMLKYSLPAFWSEQISKSFKNF